MWNEGPSYTFVSKKLYVLLLPDDPPEQFIHRSVPGPTQHDLKVRAIVFNYLVFFYHLFPPMLSLKAFFCEKKKRFQTGHN